MFEKLSSLSHLFVRTKCLSVAESSIKSHVLIIKFKVCIHVLKTVYMDNLYQQPESSDPCRQLLLPSNALSRTVSVNNAISRPVFTSRCVYVKPRFFSHPQNAYNDTFLDEAAKRKALSKQTSLPPNFCFNVRPPSPDYNNTGEEENAGRSPHYIHIVLILPTQLVLLFYYLYFSLFLLLILVVFLSIFIRFTAFT